MTPKVVLRINGNIEIAVHTLSYSLLTPLSPDGIPVGRIDSGPVKFSIPFDEDPFFFEAAVSGKRFDAKFEFLDPGQPRVVASLDLREAVVVAFEEQKDNSGAFQTIALAAREIVRSGVGFKSHWDSRHKW